MKEAIKTVVVTGAKGGTGPSLVNGFRAAGYRVIGVDLKPCGPTEDDYRQADLQDGAQVHDVLAGADAVVHFGSLPSDSATSWETAYRNIALGGYHILQAAANLHIRRLVLASSATIYGDYRAMPYFPIDEKMPHAPVGIYGAAKEHVETLARHYARWHGMAIAAIRPQRIVYEGAYAWRARPYNYDDAVAPDVLWAYLDARDLAQACRAWIESDIGGCEAFNVAADDVCVETPTRELLRKYYPHVTDLREELAGQASLVSCRKIKRMLGWKPRWNWRDIRAESEVAPGAAQPPDPLHLDPMPTRLNKAKPSRDPTRHGRNLKKRLRQGDVLIGGIMTEYARPSLVKLYAQAGFDFIYVEYEHVFFNPPDLVDFMISARDNELPIISKIPQLERAEAAKLLDNGATGIQLPRTESRADLEQLIGYMKFPPGGTRAGAPCYANTDYSWPSDHRTWLRRADEAATVVAHIETVEGYRRAEEIISTPQLDMLYIGPYDFSLAMGHPGEYDHPDVIKPMRRILEICKECHVPFGTTASGLDSARYWIQHGAQFFETSDELGFISAGARTLVSDYRKLLPRR